MNIGGTFKASRSFAELYYGIAFVRNVRFYENYWLSVDEHSTPGFHIIWTAETALWELQFHSVNITDIIEIWSNTNKLELIYSNPSVRIYQI